MFARIGTLEGHCVYFCKWSNTIHSLREIKKMIKGNVVTKGANGSLHFKNTNRLKYDFIKHSCPLNDYVAYYKDPRTKFITINRYTHDAVLKYFRKSCPMKPFYMINDKTGKHYHVYYYDGFLEDLPAHLADYYRVHIICKGRLIEDITPLGVRSHKRLRHMQSAWRAIADLGEYLIFPVSQCSFNPNKPLKSINSYRLLKDFTQVKNNN